MIETVTAHLDQALHARAIDSHMATRRFSVSWLLQTSPHPRDDGHPNSPHSSDLFVLGPPEVDFFNVDQLEMEVFQHTATQFDDDRRGHQLFLGAGSKTRPGTPIESRVIPAKPCEAVPAPLYAGNVIIERSTHGVPSSHKSLALKLGSIVAVVVLLSACSLPPQSS